VDWNVAAITEEENLLIVSISADRTWLGVVFIVDLIDDHRWIDIRDLDFVLYDIGG
jgi:hypothetical protein